MYIRLATFLVEDNYYYGTAVPLQPVPINYSLESRKEGRAGNW